MLLLNQNPHIINILTILQIGLNRAEVEGQSCDGDDGQQDNKCSRGQDNAEGSVLGVLRMRLGRKGGWGNVPPIPPDAPRIVSILTIQTVLICVRGLLVHVIVSPQLRPPANCVLVGVIRSALRKKMSDVLN